MKKHVSPMWKYRRIGFALGVIAAAVAVYLATEMRKL